MPKAIRRFLEQRQSNFIWNGQIDFWRQNYLVFTVAGSLSIQNLVFDSTHTERLSSLLSIVLVVWSVAFPLGMFAIYQLYLNPYFMKSRSTMEGRFDTLLEPVYDRSFSMALKTVFYPMLRDFVCAVTVTTLNEH
jgi:hypothetical protein